MHRASGQQSMCGFELRVQESRVALRTQVARDVIMTLFPKFRGFRCASRAIAPERLQVQLEGLSLCHWHATWTFPLGLCVSLDLAHARFDVRFMHIIVVGASGPLEGRARLLAPSTQQECCNERKCPIRRQSMTIERGASLCEVADGGTGAALCTVEPRSGCKGCPEWNLARGSMSNGKTYTMIALRIQGHTGF
jgi:hypothetical protein